MENVNKDGLSSAMRVSYHNSPVLDSGASDELSSVTRKRAPQTGLRGSRNRTYTPAELLAARTIKDPKTGCWDVQGWALPHSGHVQIQTSARGRVRAHRLAWELVHGPIPKGQVICHTCDNPRCVNVEHLFIGTQRDNILDSIRKGRYNAFGRQKLNAAQVLEIRALARRGLLHKDIARRFKVARNTVSQIVNRVCWQHV